MNTISPLTYPITIVTAYYKFKNKKRRYGQYKKYMKNFLFHMPTPLIIFTEASCVPYILSLRKAHTQHTIIIIKEFTLLNEYSRYSMWQEEHKKDPEKHIHCPNHYIIYNEKLHFVNEAQTLNPFASEWFIWMDIGAFRNNRKTNDITIDEIKQWPSKDRVYSLPKNKMIITRTEPNFNPSEYPRDPTQLATLQLRTHNHVGGLFIMHISIISTIYKVYYQILADRRKHSMFVGKEQNTLACMTIGFPELIYLLEPPPSSFPWFYIHHYLSES